eukprot:jgi/Chrzof1/3412/Cz12g24110.t1
MHARLLLLSLSFTLSAIQLSLAATKPFQNTTFPACNTGKSHLTLANGASLPHKCTPSHHDHLAHAVFECITEWKVRVSNCKVMMKPMLEHGRLGLSCKPFAAFGNLTGEQQQQRQQHHHHCQQQQACTPGSA